MRVGGRTSRAAAFTQALYMALSAGRLSEGTAHHLRQEMRHIGWGSPATMLAASVTREITRLENEAATLRCLQQSILVD